MNGSIKPLRFLYEAQIEFKGFIMLQQIDLGATLLHLWPTLDGIHERDWEKLMEIFTTAKEASPLLLSHVI